MCAIFFSYLFFFKQKTAYEMRISDWSSDVCSSDLGGPAPYVGAIARPFVRIAGAIGALRQRRAAAVLEIVDALAAHEIVADAAELDPDMAVLVPEQRLELKMLLPVIDAPVLFGVGGHALSLSPARTTKGKQVVHKVRL